MRKLGCAVIAIVALLGLAGGGWFGRVETAGAAGDGRLLVLHGSQPELGKTGEAPAQTLAVAAGRRCGNEVATATGGETVQGAAATHPPSAAGADGD